MDDKGNTWAKMNHFLDLLFWEIDNVTIIVGSILIFLWM